MRGHNPEPLHVLNGRSYDWVYWGSIRLFCHIQINQVIGGISIECRTTLCGSPPRGGISEGYLCGWCAALDCLPIKSSDVFPYRACRNLWITSVCVIACIYTSLPAGIGLDNTGINGKAFAAHQALAHTAPQYTFKHMTEQIAVAETPVAVLIKVGVIKHRILQP